MESLVRKNILKTQLKDLLPENIERQLASYRRLLKHELKARGLNFNFHIYVGEEWFCVDGVPGFAVPFYLFNPTAREIIISELGEAEGSHPKELYKYLRHELGHAFDNAYGLRTNKVREERFGSSAKKYPSFYNPNPYSKSFVKNLPGHYAQSHPDEDFAETFAVWLAHAPSVLKDMYGGTVALGKIEGIEELVSQVRYKKQKRTNKFRFYDVMGMNRTLSEYIQSEKRKKNKIESRKIQCVESFVYNGVSPVGRQRKKPMPSKQLLGKSDLALRPHIRKKIIRNCSRVFKKKLLPSIDFYLKNMNERQWSLLLNSKDSHLLYSESM